MLINRLKKKLFRNLSGLLLLFFPLFGWAQAPNLGSSSGFALFTTTGAINVLGASTNVVGDVGNNVGAFSGFPPGTLVGQKHSANQTTASAAAAVASAYSQLSGTSCGTGGVLVGTLGNGQILTPNVYCHGAATTLNGTLILDGGGNPNAIFIIKINGALATSIGSSISLINGADLCNVYWQINGMVTLASSFSGTIVASGAISMLDGASLTGRALTTAGAINLQNNSVALGMPTAAVITAGSATTFCAGMSVVLSGNSGGVWSNGATSSSITVNTTGDYFVTTTNGCGTINSNHIAVIVNPLPVASVITAGGAISFCAGNSVTLSGNSGGIWSTGASTASINVTSSGDYFVTTTNSCGSLISNHIIVTVSPLPVVSVITAGGPIVLCAGASVTLSGNNGGTWSTGAVTASITVNTSGDYYVSTVNSCGTVTSNHIIVTISPQPIASVISANRAVTFCAGGSVVLSGNAGGVWSNLSTSGSITVTTSGDYFVTNTNSCGSVISNHIIVTVNPLPTVSVIAAAGPILFCAGGSVVLSGNSGGVWSNAATTASITVSTSGDYFVTTTNSCGSVVSNHIVVNVNPVIVPSTLTAGGPVTFCEGASVVLSGNTGGIWSNGATTAAITVTASGNYSVTNTNACGSVTSNHIIVTVNPKPIVSVIAANGPISFCQGGTVILSGNNGGVWSTGATTPSITVSAAGDYSVTTTNSCGTATSNHILVTVNNPLTASVISASGATVFCTGQSITLSGNTNGGIWSNGSIATSITVVASGDFFVTNTNTCGTVISNHILVRVSPPTTPSIITANRAINFCIGDSVILSGNINGTWSNGAKTSSIVVKTSGEYFVSNTDTCGIVNSNRIIVKVDLPPVVSILVSGLTTFCEPGSVTISGNVGGVWNTGATSSSLVVTRSGEYFVTNSNACGTLVSNKIIVTVNPLPVASVIVTNRLSDTICLGDSITLTGNIGGIWNTGATSASIKVKTTGSYFVTNMNACDTVTSNIIQVYTDSLPSSSVIIASGPTTICTGDSVILTGNNGGIWSTGATTSSITIKVSGDYFVTQLNSCDSGVSNHIQVKVRTKTNPNDRIIQVKTICEGDSIKISGNINGVWNNGSKDSTIVVKTSGRFFVIDENFCDSIGLHVVTELTVLPRPIAPPIVSDTICAGTEITLGSSPIAGHSYLWKTNYGIFVSTQANPIVQPTVTTTYVLKETILGGNCDATYSVKITVGPLPSCTIRGNNMICNGGSTQLCAPEGPYTYLWSTGQTTSCITVSAIGNYSVIVTTSLGCSSTCSRNVISGNGPCDITGTGLIYAGQSTEFCAPKGYASYKWSSGETSRCINVKNAGTYSLTVTNAQGCSSICSKVLTVAPAVVCEIIGDSVICPNSIAILCAIDVPGNTYFWNNGQTTRCIEINCEGTYSVKITNNGASSVCVIKVKNAVPIASLAACLITGNLNPNQGDSTTLCGPAGYYIYSWNTGATSRCIKVGKSGTYTLNAGNDGGCTKTCSAIVNYPSLRRSLPIDKPVDVVVAPRFELKVYPNPFTSTANFEFQTDQFNSLVKVEITGLSGNLITTLFNDKVERGQVYRWNLDGRSLAEGIYICRITNGNLSITRKLVLIR